MFLNEIYLAVYVIHMLQRKAAWALSLLVCHAVNDL